MQLYVQSIIPLVFEYVATNSTMRRVQECPIRRKRKTIKSCCQGFPALSISPFLCFPKSWNECLPRNSNQFLQNMILIYCLKNIFYALQTKTMYGLIIMSSLPSIMELLQPLLSCCNGRRSRCCLLCLECVSCSFRHRSICL